MKKILTTIVFVILCLALSTTVLAADYVFTSTISETQNELTVNLDISPSVKNSYFIINAYKNNRVVASKLVKADTLNKEIQLNCRQKPDDIRVNIWNSLVNVKPVIDTVQYKSEESGNIQTFTPKESFPADFSYVEGVLCANEKISVDGTMIMEKDYISVLSANNTYTAIYAPGINTDQYLGKNVVVAYETANEENILKNINETEGNSIAVIDTPSDIIPNDSYMYSSDLITDSYGNTLSGIISVYDEDVDTTNTEYRLDNANIIFNGAYIQASYWNTSIGGALGTYLSPSFGSVKLLDNDGDNKYEYIFVTSYETKVVDAVFGQNKKIGMKIGSTIDLSNHIDEKEGYTYSITLDGKKIDISDLKEYDVISVASSFTGKNIEIIVSRNVVEGSVESIESHINKLKEVYKIAGKEYRISNIASTGYYPLINIDTEGYFYLDAFNRIAMTEAYTISGTVAFITNLESYIDSNEEKYIVYLLNSDGTSSSYPLDNNIAIKCNQRNAIITSYNELTYGSGKTSSDLVYQYIKNLLANEKNNMNYAKRMIAYKTTSSNTISTITFPDEYGYEGMSIAQGCSADKYNATVSCFAYGVTDETIIFYLPIDGSVNDYKIIDKSYLIHESLYDTTFLNIDDNCNAGIMIITNYNINLGNDSLAIVTKSSIQKNSNNEDVITVSFLKDGEEQTLIVDADSDINDIENNPFIRGSLFEYCLNFDGEIEEAEFCGTYDSIAFTPIDVKAAADAGDVFKIQKSGNMKFEYIAGYVIGRHNNLLSLTNYFNSIFGARTYIPESANIYLVDYSKSVPAVSIGSISDIYPVETAYENGTVYTKDLKDTYVLIKYIKDEPVDVIVYNGFSPYSTGEIQQPPETIDIPGTLAFMTRFGSYISSDEEKYEIELMNSDGNTVGYTLCNNVSVTYNGFEKSTLKSSEVAEIISSLLENTASPKNYAKRMISYSVNADEIYEINFSVEGINGGLSYYASNSSYADYKYDEKTKTIGPFGVTDKTTIFYLPSNEWEGAMYDEFRVLNISHLQDGAKYTTAYLDIDKDGNAGIMIITAIATNGGNDSLAIVTKSSIQKNSNNEDVIAVTFLKDGEDQTLLVDADSDINDIENNPFVRGSLFEYCLNFDGEIEEAAFCGTYDSIAFTPANVKAAADAGDVFKIQKLGNMKFEYIAGYVVGKSGSTLILNTDFATHNGYKILIPQDANIYTIDFSKAKIVPEVASIGDIVACKYYTDGNYAYAEKYADTYVLIKYINDVIVDVIAYTGFEPSKQIL